MQPMYLVLNPPQMLPTQTLNPTATATATHKARVRRGQEEDGDREGDEAQKLLRGMHHPDAPLNGNAKVGGRRDERYNPDKFWWFGVGCVALGTVLYMWPTSEERRKQQAMGK